MHTSQCGSIIFCSQRVFGGLPLLLQALRFARTLIQQKLVQSGLTGGAPPGCVLLQGPRYLAVAGLRCRALQANFSWRNVTLTFLTLCSERDFGAVAAVSRSRNLTGVQTSGLPQNAFFRA
jgi:hypothetical protein